MLVTSLIADTEGRSREGCTNYSCACRGSLSIYCRRAYTEGINQWASEPTNDIGHRISPYTRIRVRAFDDSL